MVAAGAVLVIAAILIFAGLGRQRLWVDEAETALLARSAIRHGVPTAIDGKDVISQEAGREFGPDGVWRWTPWLDKYLAAASFLLLGEGTYQARLPFALTALAAVASVYPFAWSLFRDRRVAVLAMAFLALSVPFLLHARQCRYYAPAILGFLWAVHFAAAAVRADRGAVAGLVTAMTVVFHSNYMTFVAASVSLAAAVWILGVDRGAIRRFAVAAVLVLAINGPWALYFNVLGKSGEAGRISSFASNLRAYAGLTGLYGFPFAAVLPFAGLGWWARRRGSNLVPGETRPVLYLAALSAAYVVTISAAPWVFYRYTVNLLPVFALLLAWMSVKAWTWNRAAGAILAACLLLGGVFQRISNPFLPFPRSGERSFAAFDWAFPLGNYLHELTHPFRDATSSIVDHLAAHGNGGDRVFISYGDLVLRFYLRLEVRGGQSGQRLDGWPPPEWVVVRRFFRFGDRPHLQADAERMAAWLEREIPWDRYEEIRIPQPDLPWEGIPEPQMHYFRAPTRGEPVRILRLARPSR
jgi:hypothetical protein